MSRLHICIDSVYSGEWIACACVYTPFAVPGAFGEMLQETSSFLEKSYRVSQLDVRKQKNQEWKAWDLRCLVRERFIQFLRDHYPEKLPTSRIEYRNSPNEEQAFRPLAAIGDRASSSL